VDALTVNLKWFGGSKMNLTAPGEEPCFGKDNDLQVVLRAAPQLPAAVLCVF
jgi:hypothetical protein